MKRKSLLVVAIVLVASLIGCTRAAQEDRQTPQVERNVYTDLPGSNGRILAVKFDDTRNAHPQQGVENADVVFITQVEAGLTRLMGIYSSNYPEVLGPVRSARISDLDILAQFGRVGFVYSGSQSKLRPVITASNLENLSAERNPPTIYFNEPSRNAPYAMMVKPNLLLDKAGDLDTARSIGWEHGAKAKTAKRIISAKISWPNATYEAIWNKNRKRFDLNHDGQTNVSTSGKRLGSPMMVIQIVEIAPSEYGDKYGGITPKSKVMGSGVAYLLRNGSVTRAKWIRPDAQSQTQWLLEDGGSAYFAPGQVWMFLTDQEPEFKYPSPNPAKSGAKS